MPRRAAYLLALITFAAGSVVGGAAGVLLFIRTVGGSGEASATINAPTLALVLTPTPAGAVALDPVATLQPGQQLFRIVPERSEARFIVDELRPFISGLVGSTDQVAGDILVDFDQPANSRLGIIRINVRTLRTDDPDRDRVIRGVILLSDRPENEFSDFVPTGITGLPDAPVEVEDDLNFQVTGDFAVRGITRSLTFDVTLTVASRSELRGLARTTINRADYDLLQEGLVEHGVSEDVTLELEFVARVVTA